MKSCFIFTLLLMLSWQGLYAQCGLTISAYPYTESFETGTGGWSSGGTGNDWAWGSPSKAFITSAGAGSKCWVTGGLTGSFYTNGQRSYVQGPCFNFSTLTNPVISMKIFWECENIYDGACLQSSIDNGLSWQNVGSSFDQTNCMNQQWYNNLNIINLASLANPKEGWAGSSLPTSGSCQGGGGSNGWVTAKHCLTNLGGQALVRLRFAFGAGTACNGFDGFAFDDLKIEEGPLNNANFTYNCTSTPLQYQFNNTSTPCPSIMSWNFGDPSSGVNNGSGQVNPTHIFSAPGTYIVSLTVSGPCNGASTMTKTITTVGISLTPMNISCGSLNNGSISAVGLGGTGPFTFSLQPSGITNTIGLFTSLTAGLYTVTLTDAYGCSNNSTALLTSPPPFIWTSFLHTPITCNGLQNGSFNVLATGGIGSIQYTLYPGGIVGSGGNFNSLAQGSYTVVATDASGCSISSVSVISEPPSLNIASIDTHHISCYGNSNGQALCLASGGTGSFSYLLNPGGISNTTGNFSGLLPGTYTIQVADANACKTATIITITEPPELSISNLLIKKPTCVPNNNGEIKVLAIGGTQPLSYSLGGSFSTIDSFINLTSNTYTLTVKDANNCSTQQVINLQSENAPQFNLSTFSHPSCNDKSDGTITVQAMGTQPISYYKLSPGGSVNGTGQFIHLKAGNYMVTVVDVNQCSNTVQLSLTAPPVLSIEKLFFQADSCGSGSSGKLICEVTGGNGGYNYSLNPGNLNGINGQFENIRPGDYQILVTDMNACSISAPVKINERICCEDVFVPNAFSPNGDGRNDEFKMLGLFGTELKEFFIFSRWGQLIFKARNINDAWDGKIKGIEAEIGTYFYQIRYLCNSSKKEYLLKGDLLLLR